MNPYTDDDIEYKNTLCIHIHDRQYRHEAQRSNRPIGYSNTNTTPATNESIVFTLSSSSENILSSESFNAQLSEMNETPADLYNIYTGDDSSEVNDLKSMLSFVDYEKLSTARSRSNPHESLGRSIFMNRGAVKLANIDTMFSLIATSSKNKILTFADLGGGPGGFSEYMLWRRHTWGEEAKGWAITLSAASGAGEEKDFNLDQFHADALARQNLTIIYGKSPNDTGDLCNQQISDHFANVVFNETNQQGVDIVVADGAFDVTGKEQEQETLSLHLILNEINVMLRVLRVGGTFVCKFFDLHHPCTVELLYVLYQSFEKIHIVKPVCSRPANAERETYSNNRMLEDISKDPNSTVKLQSILNTSVVKNDGAFINWLKDCNQRLACRQTTALKQILRYIKNPQLPPCTNQEEVRRQCFTEWNLPLDLAQE
ncbi:FtsJ-like methyltransferase-domain-containing protein [Syncephalis fuscata]|nr:FtsJ-like methyltransferase-domain-containing protein [Syncephalis fuscata]